MTRLNNAVKKLIDNAAKGWARHGVAASEGRVYNWGVEGCPRWVVVLTYGNFNGGSDLFLNELDSYREASALAGQVTRRFQFAFAAELDWREEVKAINANRLAFVRELNAYVTA